MKWYSIVLAILLSAVAGSIVVTALAGYKIPIHALHDDVHLFPMAKNCYPEVAGYIGINRHAVLPMGKYYDMIKALRACNNRELSAKQMEILTKAAAQTEYDIVNSRPKTALEKASQKGGDAILRGMGKDHYGMPLARPTL